MDSLEQNLCLAPDQKMVGTKIFATDQKINLASEKLFFVKKRHNL
jgi:hypothetical protein